MSTSREYPAPQRSKPADGLRPTLSRRRSWRLAMSLTCQDRSRRSTAGGGVWQIEVKALGTSASSSVSYSPPGRGSLRSPTQPGRVASRFTRPPYEARIGRPGETPRVGDPTPVSAAAPYDQAERDRGRVPSATQDLGEPGCDPCQDLKRHQHLVSMSASACLRPKAGCGEVEASKRWHTHAIYRYCQVIG
jgi:hypothetical protein